MSTSDDELDNILDNALDAFNLDEKPSAPTGTITQAASTGAPTGNAVTGNKESISDSNTTAGSSRVQDGRAGGGAGGIPGNLDEEAALRAFREALTAPLEGDDPEDEEADLALVEEFIRGLDVLNDGGGAGGGPGGAQTPAAAESFVKQLLEDMLSKEVLREPVAQIRDALAKSLAEEQPPGSSGGGLSEEDRARHEEQHAIADELCKEFDSGARPERVVELLAKLRDSGQLPDSIAANLPDPDSDADQLAGLADTADACPVQ